MVVGRNTDLTNVLQSNYGDLRQVPASCWASVLMCVPYGFGLGIEDSSQFNKVVIL